MYLDRPLIDYLSNLASSQPTPGGGSVAALSGAMGAGLACMVVQLSQGKSNDTALEQELETILQQVEELRIRFQRLIQEDIEAYGRLSAAFKMPRDTAEERALRSSTIQKQLLDAAQVPLEITEHAAELVLYCQRVAEIGNKNVLSDIAVGTLLASSAGNGASWMVRTNLKAMKNSELAGILNERLHVALDKITIASQRVLNIVGERA